MDAPKKPETVLTNEQMLRKALKDLSRHYVMLLETARERILFYGGDCDPVETMERGDPYLRQAREAIAKAESAPEPAQPYHQNCATCTCREPV